MRLLWLASFVICECRLLTSMLTQQVQLANFRLVDAIFLCSASVPSRAILPLYSIISHDATSIRINPNTNRISPHLSESFLVCTTPDIPLHHPIYLLESSWRISCNALFGQCHLITYFKTRVRIRTTHFNADLAQKTRFCFCVCILILRSDRFPCTLIFRCRFIASLSLRSK